MESNIEKTFTQDEVNKIVQERLAKERKKMQEEHATALSEMEKSVKARELRMNAMEKLQSKGLPSNLVDALNCTDDKTMDNSIEILANAYKQTDTHIKQNYTPINGGAVTSDPIREAMGL